MVSPQTNIECLGRLGMLRHFPVKENVVAAIGRLLNEICQSDEEARRLAAFVSDRYAEWPGPAELRKIHWEIATRQDMPRGCSNCPEIPGYRHAFVVMEGIGRPDTRQWFYPGSGPLDLLTMEQDLRDRYPEPYCVYSVMAPCTCPLGQQRRDQDMRERERGRR